MMGVIWPLSTQEFQYMLLKIIQHTLRMATWDFLGSLLTHLESEFKNYNGGSGEDSIHISA